MAARGIVCQVMVSATLALLLYAGIGPWELPMKDVVVLQAFDAARYARRIAHRIPGPSYHFIVLTKGPDKGFGYALGIGPPSHLVRRPSGMRGTTANNPFFERC